MAKYIDADKFSVNLDTARNPDSEFATDDYIDGFSDGISFAMRKLEAMIAADVAPVKHGHWEQVDETKCRCSCCDIIVLIGLYPHGDKNYCPNCGAEMDAKESENDG